MVRRFLFVIIMLISCRLYAQEIQSRINILANKVSSQTDRKIFQTLQTGLTNFVNSRKWSNDVFQQSEKIQCSFLITIDQDLGNNIFKGKLTVQAARPAYNTSYDSPLINFQDEHLIFKYVEFQPIEFNENRVQGNDPMVANLTAIIAYYVNVILGLDYDSFGLKGGVPYFQKAWNIVNNAPDGTNIEGWKSFDGLRNRYWLAENLNNNRFTLVHDAIYAYYRTGLDMFFENEDAGRNGMLTALNYLNTVNTENLNSMLLAVFFQGRGNELVRFLSNGTAEQKANAKTLLSKLDIINLSLYKAL